MDSDNIIDLAQERRRRGPRFNGGLMEILEVARDLICLCRSGKITAINGAGVRLLGGVSTDELLGRRLTDFLIPEYGPVLELFLAGKASGDKAVPTRLVGIDQCVRDVEMQVYPAREIAPDATVVMCRDISHEGKLDGPPYQADARFSHLVDNAMNLVCHVVDGRIHYVNRAGIRMLAADVEALVGRPVAEIFHDDYADVFSPDLLDSAIAETDGLPMRLRRLDGEPVDVMAMITRLPSNQGLELMIETRDITAHNRAVTALRRANETLEMRVAERTREVDEQRSLAVESRQIADASRRFTESLMDMIPSPVWFRDARGAFQTCNRAFRDLFGCDPATQPETAPKVWAAMPSECRVSDAEILAGVTDSAVLDATIAVAGGQTRHVLVAKCAFRDDDGNTVGVLGVITDITERKAMERELGRLATTDPLTGAANRRQFTTLANQGFDRAAREGHAVSIVMLDIDHFKRINDTHGHATGDKALKALVASVSERLREGDVLGRLGGEEFAILLPETSEAGGLDAAERLRETVSAIRVALPDGDHLSMTASLGVACDPNGAQGLDALLARADEALYRAKHAGRNRTEVG